jgi:hypothetical protein
VNSRFLVVEKREVFDLPSILPEMNFLSVESKQLQAYS